MININLNAAESNKIKSSRMFKIKSLIYFKSLKKNARKLTYERMKDLTWLQNLEPGAKNSISRRNTS